MLRCAQQTADIGYEYSLTFILLDLFTLKKIIKDCGNGRECSKRLMARK